MFNFIRDINNSKLKSILLLKKKMCLSSFRKYYVCFNEFQTTPVLILANCNLKIKNYSYYTDKTYPEYLNSLY